MIKPPIVCEYDDGALSVSRIALTYEEEGGPSVNVYAVRSGGDILLVDAGVEGEKAAGELACALGLLGASSANARCFLTHMHHDHASLTHLLPAGIQLWCDRAAFEARTDARQAQAMERFALLAQAMGCSAAEARELAVVHEETSRVDGGRFRMRFWEPGERIHVGGVAFEVVPSPGHTADHAFLWEPARGLLFSGDALLRDRLAMVELFEDGSDGMARYFDSLRLIERLAPRLVLPGHGGALGGGEAVALARSSAARKRRRIDRIAALLADPACTCGRWAAMGRLGCEDEAQWMERSAFIRYFIMLEVAVTARHLGKGWELLADEPALRQGRGAGRPAGAEASYGVPPCAAGSADLGQSGRGGSEGAARVHGGTGEGASPQWPPAAVSAETRDACGPSRSFFQEQPS